MLPPDFPHWRAVYEYFSRWKRDGTWLKIHDYLHADFLAGWDIGIRALQLPGQVNLQEIAKGMFDIGDFNFDNPSHHGTPEERADIYTPKV